MPTDMVEKILQKYRGDDSSLIAILQDVQQHYGHIPETVAKRIALGLGIPLGRIYSLATFYRAFTLTPRALYPISVCLGTACHVRGGQRILASLERELGIKAGQTAPDGRFGIEAVRCLGCCGLAPVVTVGADVYGGTTPAKARKILKRYTISGARATASAANVAPAEE
jgi:NADH:ubiquinone oxidoreductase subunit E